MWMLAECLLLNAGTIVEYSVSENIIFNQKDSYRNKIVSILHVFECFYILSSLI